MSGSIKGRSYQNVLMHLVDKCKLNLEKPGVSDAIMTNLSNTLDCLSNKLVIPKLPVYVFDKNSCNFTNIF